jgi:hypothetical protein
MATALTKPLTRLIEHNGRSYRVTLSSTGVHVAEKGRRRGTNVAWDEILAKDEPSAPAADVPSGATSGRLGMPEIVAADVLLLLSRVDETVKEASGLIEGASALPGILARQRVPLRPTDFEQGDWHVEPLLTTKQVSQLLSVSTRRVRALPLRSIEVGGQTRFRRSELRRFLTSSEKEQRRRDR